MDRGQMDRSSGTAMAPDRSPVGGGPRMRTLVRRIANPLVLRLGLAGGNRSAWGVITVTGRRSGRPRTNPVLPHRSGDDVIIPLSFGEGVHWLRNVHAAGEASLRFRGRRLRLVEPRVVDLDAIGERLPGQLLQQYRRLRYERLLVMRVVEPSG